MQARRKNFDPQKEVSSRLAIGGFSRVSISVKYSYVRTGDVPKTRHYQTRAKNFPLFEINCRGASEVGFFGAFVVHQIVTQKMKPTPNTTTTRIRMVEMKQVNIAKSETNRNLMRTRPKDIDMCQSGGGVFVMLCDMSSLTNSYTSTVT